VSMGAEENPLDPEWKKETGFLTVKMTGPSVRSGAILVQDLEAALSGLRTSLERLAQRKIEGPTQPRRGPRIKEVKASVRLYLRDYEPGSAIVKLELRPEQHQLVTGLPGSEVISEWMEGTRALRDPARRLPESFDDAVLSGMQMLNPLLNKGIDEFEFIWESGGKSARTKYDAPASARLKTLLLKPAANRRTVSGFLLSADFLSPDVKFTVFTEDGRPVACTTSPDRLGVVLEGIMHYVRISGDATVQPGTDVIRSIRVDSLEVDRSVELFGEALPFEDIRDFWMGAELDDLVRRQQVAPIPAGEVPDWSPPSDEEWARYQSVMSRKKRRTLPEGE
jgi:hypothetical protein